MNKSMSGTCAVGLVIVNGPDSAAFTQGEIVDITIGLLRGWSTLYKLAGTYSPVRPRLLFTVDYKFVTLTVDPATIPAATSASPTGADYTAREPLWRDPALAAMGFGPGIAGIASYNTSLLNKAWSIGTATSAYTVFITKYPAAWMAYTYGASAYMVLQYPWVSTNGSGFPAGGWGNSWPNVYAHETGHIFQAPDEYFASSCSKTATFGALNVPNSNCQTTATEAVSSCLMFHNTEDLCNATVQTFGWVDADGDGVLDVTP